MRFIKLFLFLMFITILVACSENEEPGKSEINLKPITVSYKTTDGIIYRDAPKDSFVYSNDNIVEHFYQTRSTGTVRHYFYEENSDGDVSVYRDLEEESEYVINAPVGNSFIIDLTKYERQSGTPGIIKYTTEGNVIIITRWEYPSLEKEDYVMEVDGDPVKRTILTLNEKGNISKIEVLVWDYYHGFLETKMTYTDLVYDDLKNPLKGLRKEYKFNESGPHYNHEFLEYYCNNNVISYSANYHNEVSGEIDGTNYYTFSYQFDSEKRIISSRAGVGSGEYFDNITSITY
jgi:hypothetical protein